MDLNEILIFAKVVKAGSFTGAARELGMPKSTVSRKLSELEERLGARLLHRTTRKLSLTDVGQAYYRHATRVAFELEEAERAVTHLQEVPRGQLRVTAPLDFELLGPIAGSFLRAYPEVQLEIVCTDHVVDLVADGFDVGIRAGRLADSSLVARRVGSMRSVLVASPGYLAEHGTPRTLADLGRHQILLFGGGSAASVWRLSKGDATETFAVVNPRLVVNDFDLLVEATAAGVGITLMPLLRGAEALRAGRLARILSGYCSTETPVHAVYPSSRHLTPKLRAFVDHLASEMDAALRVGADA